MATPSEPSPLDAAVTPIKPAARSAAVQLLNHPSLGIVLIDLATNPDARDQAAADPHAYLATKGIQIPQTVGLHFNPADAPGTEDFRESGDGLGLEGRQNCRLRILGICLF